MLSYIIILAIATTTSITYAKPSGVIAAPLAVAPAVVTSHSSQVVARQYNALVAPAAAPLVARAAPYVVPAAPVVAPAAPLVAPAAPLLSGYRFASPYVSSPYIASPYAW